MLLPILFPLLLTALLLLLRLWGRRGRKGLPVCGGAWDAGDAWDDRLRPVSEPSFEQGGHGRVFLAILLV
jgi:hypothetical protein